MGFVFLGWVHVRFAMAAPGSVEFYKDILLIVHDDVLVIVCDDNLNRAFLLFRDGLGFDAWLNFAVNEFLYESTNIFRGELLVLVKGELLVLDRLLDGEGGPFVDFEVEVAGVGAKRLGVDCGEAKGTFVFLSEWLECLC